MSNVRINRLVLILAACLVPMAANAGGPYQFYSITPCRIVDTRNSNGPTGGPILTATIERDFPITGYCGVPTTAQQIFINITAVSPSANGFIEVWPYNTSRPIPFSNMNLTANTPAIANGALVTLTADPNFNIAVVYWSATGGATTHFLIDVLGYLQ